MTFDQLAKAIESLYANALFGKGNDNPCDEEEGTLDVFAEQEFLQCLAMLKTAQSAASKAHLHQMRGRAESQRKGLIG